MIEIIVGLIVIVSVLGSMVGVVYLFRFLSILIGRRMGATNDFEAEDAGHLIFLVLFIIIAVIACAYPIGKFVLEG